VDCDLLGGEDQHDVALLASGQRRIYLEGEVDRLPDVLLRVAADLQLVLAKVDVDEGVNCDQQAYLLNLPLHLQEDVVLLQDEIADVFEVGELQPTSGGIYFLMKDLMYFMLISFSCFDSSLHSSAVIDLDSSSSTE
jgi:hypothetical protein